MSNLAVVILAAGKSTRMKSELPKPLHQVAGRPMLAYVLRAARAVQPERIMLVVGSGDEQVRKAFAGAGVEFVLQEPQLGTGHALLMAEDALKQHRGPVLCLFSDTPLLRGETLKRLVETYQPGVGAVLLTAEVEDPGSLGRVIRQGGQVTRIVEERDATAEQKAIREINIGPAVYGPDVFQALAQLGRANAQGEVYLTDLVQLYSSQGREVRAVSAPQEALGVNDRAELAQAEKLLRDRIRLRVMKEGVTLLDPPSTFLDDTVHIAPDVVIYPGCIIEGDSHIASGAVIGPYTHIRSSQVGAGTSVRGWCLIVDSTIGPACTVGPFAHLRDGAVLDGENRLGNFVEVKKSRLGREAKASHLAYIGDAQIGEESNIGAGVVFVNYDGERKHPTQVGQRAMIGSNASLVAPLTIGDDAYVTAGSVITEDVPSGALAFGRARQVTRPGRAEELRKKLRGKG